ncbi:aerolysin-like protein [Carassius auratus]|uniref:Aerolysin-like protein n=1 Tax=Carassius auratus TaxID=7957 RepID=A0A6P6MWN0_CARAU|nr:aerolysin-like protein [Carassius auratus]XP_052425619.1 aerolysin-like protein [Carassius gibelio]
MANQGRHLCPETVIVGGTGGDDFSFKSASYVTIKKVNVTYSETALTSIQVIFNCGHMIKVGNLTGSQSQEIKFDDYDKITYAKLWPNITGNRCGGFEFVVAKSNGVTTTLSVKCKQLGQPVCLDVKSGKINGITGRSGDEIDALGFYFI